MSQSLSRREFLKLAGVTSVAAFLSSQLQPGLKLVDFAEAASLSEKLAGTKYVPNICAMCSTGCGITVRVRGGRVERIIGSNTPNNQGKICARGNLGVFRLYNPDRLKRPLIRDDPSTRGEWRFRAASWDEALGVVASQIKKHIDTKTTPQIGVMGGWIVCGYYKPFMKAFMATIKSPNGVGIPQPQCFMPKVIGWKSTIGVGVHPEIMVDYENVRYLIAIKRNLFAGLGIPHAQRLGRRREQVKIVVLDPRMSETAAKADEWVPVKPGTDLAFVLAMMNVIVAKKLYDEEYLKKYTDAPMLLRKDTLTPLKLVDDKTTGKKKYLVWDSASSSARIHEEAANPALLGSYTVDGVEAIPAFQALVDKVKQYTPAWASKITGVDAATIERIAREFATTKPSAITTGWHDVKHRNSFMLWRAIAVLLALVGSIGRKGGVLLTGPGLANTLKPSAAAAPESSVLRRWAEEKGVALAKLGISYQAFYDAITKGRPYPIKTLLLLGVNAVRTLSDAPKWAEAFKRLDKLVVVDILPSDTTLYADVVLPEHTYLERDDPLYGIPQAFAAGFRTRFKAVEPLYDTRHLIDIITGILERLGSDYYVEYFEHLAEKLGIKDPEALRAAYEKKGVRGIMELQAETKGVDIRSLETGGFVVKIPEPALRSKVWSIVSGGKLATPTGKIEVFSLMVLSLRKAAKSEDAKKLLDPLVTWAPPRTVEERPALAQDEFYLAFGRVPTMTHSATADNPVLQKLTPDYNRMVWVNPKRAASLGLSTGDLVEVVNPKVGVPVKARVFVTEMVREDTLFLAGDWVEGKAMTFVKEAPPLSLLTELNYEPVTGAAMIEEAVVKVRRIGR